MNKLSSIFVFVVSLVLLSSCGISNMATKSEVYSTLYDESPKSILLMPPINRTTKVEAKELFYNTMSIPLTQKGYYVMPPLLAMEILKEESAYDSELFLDNSMKQAGKLFGVDAVLFTIIHEWRKASIAAEIQVKVEYILKSTVTDAVLFNRIGDITLNLSSGNNGLLGLIVDAAVTALTNEIKVARNCNIYTLDDLPEGKYSPDFQNDGNQGAGEKEFSTVISQYY